MLLLLYQRISSYQEETSDNISLPGVIKKCYMSLDKLQLVFLSFFFLMHETHMKHISAWTCPHMQCVLNIVMIFFFVNNLVKECE